MAHLTTSTTGADVTIVTARLGNAIARTHLIPSRSDRVRVAVGHSENTVRTLGEMTHTEALALRDALTALLDDNQEN
jgi:hypothetical protein